MGTRPPEALHAPEICLFQDYVTYIDAALSLVAVTMVTRESRMSNRNGLNSLNVCRTDRVSRLDVIYMIWNISLLRKGLLRNPALENMKLGKCWSSSKVVSGTNFEDKTSFEIFIGIESRLYKLPWCVFRRYGANSYYGVVHQMRVGRWRRLTGRERFQAFYISDSGE